MEWCGFSYAVQVFRQFETVGVVRWGVELVDDVIRMSLLWIMQLSYWRPFLVLLFRPNFVKVHRGRGVAAVHLLLSDSIPVVLAVGVAMWRIRVGPDVIWVLPIATSVMFYRQSRSLCGSSERVPVFSWCSCVDILAVRPVHGASIVMVIGIVVCFGSCGSVVLSCLYGEVVVRFRWYGVPTFLWRDGGGSRSC